MTAKKRDYETREIRLKLLRDPEFLKDHSPPLELYLKLFHIQSKEFGNNKCYGETTQLEKSQSEISPDIRKEMEDSWLNAIKKNRSRSYEKAD